MPPCTVDGTRAVTYDGRTREVRNATTDLLIDRYQVDFAGRLAIDGAPVATGPNPIFPFGGGARDASNFFFDSDDQQVVDVTASYTGERIQVVPTGGAGASPQTDPAYWSRVGNLATTVNSIDIDITAFTDTSDGNGYDFRLASIDPTAIVNNGTAVRGSFKSDDDNRTIQFGTINGTATLTGGYQVTPYPDDVGANNTGLLSLYQLAYDVTATVTTQLDETGLVTPRVVVSDGIEMNGSRVTGLGAGVDGGDAVNKAQLDGEAATRLAADTALNTALAAEVVAREGADTQIIAALDTEVTTRQQADLQLSQRIGVQETTTSAFTANLAAEQAARIAADNVTATRLTSLDGRVGDLEARMDAFDDGVAGATAVATAMSGNAFLPDMRFNLTANVATYDGAHAGALQIGAMVTPHVAINAGVATGFNRGGKTAARAGVTVGF